MNGSDVLPASEPAVRAPRTLRSAATIVAAVACSGAAAWLSLATVAFTGAGAGRVALLPLTAGAGVIVAFVAAAVFIAARRGLSLAPLWLLTFLILPWLPVPVPVAFAMWTGHMVWLIWIAVVACMVAERPPRAPILRSSAWPAVVLSGLIYAFAAWQVSPSIPGGDEPHYLVITQSLLSDHDLRIENNHQRGDYRAYFAGELKPDFIQRGKDGEIYSIHAPGLPLLVAPAFALGGYLGVVAFLIGVAALGSGLVWRLAWLLTRRQDAAWFSWAAVSLSTTAVFHAFTVYPDGVGGVLVASGAWAILRIDEERRTGRTERPQVWAWHGTALALLPWLHTRFAVLAAVLGGIILLRFATTKGAVRNSMVFLAVPVISGVCWIGFFVAIYGTPSPTAPYGREIGSAAYVADGIAGLFLDQRFGLLPYAPVLVLAFAGLVAMIGPHGRGARPLEGARRLGLELLCVCVPYVLIVTTYRMWWAGWSAPARFLVPILPLFAIPVAAAWMAIRDRATRTTARAALLYSLVASAVLVCVDGGALAYNVRTAPSHLLGWWTTTIDLAGGVPAWGDRDPRFFVEAAIWCAALAAGWWILRVFERRPLLAQRSAIATATAGVYAVMGMLAWTAVAATDRSVPRGAVGGQIDLLQRAAVEPRAMALTLVPWSPLSVSALVSRLRLRLTAPLPGDEPLDVAAPMFVVSDLPAGRYRLTSQARGAGGTLSVIAGRKPGAAVLGTIDGPAEPLTLDLPVDAGLVVRGDAPAWASVRGLTIEPLSLVAASARLTGAHPAQTARYDDVVLFFLDDCSFPEPTAFWTRGGCSASFVARMSPARSVLSVLLRNAPVANHVTITTDSERMEFDLRAGEQRRIDLRTGGRAATRVTIAASAGFRPSDADPSAGDHRWLGVWLQPLR